MTKIICINQSNYVPWRGYFDLIRKSDEFIIGDHVQYTHKDWRHRNKIKTRAGLQWLSVPVQSTGRIETHQRIDETRVVNQLWVGKHLKSLHHAYHRAPHFAWTFAWLEPLYRQMAGESLLSHINERMLRVICSALDIRTPFSRTTDYLDAATMDSMDRTSRIISLCRAARATRYLSGPAAKGYLDEAAMAAAGIEVEWMDYTGYPPYPQLWGAFEPNISIVDLLFCVGARARDYIGRDAYVGLEK